MSKPRNIAAVLFLALGAMALGVKQERERLLEWFEDLDWYWQAFIGTVVVLLILLSASWIVAPYLKSLI